MTDDEHGRREPRQRTVRAAVIITGDGAKSLPCIVLDTSKSGARLHVHNPSETPDSFELRIEIDQSAHTCEIVWRKGNEIGVKFKA